MCDKGQQNIVKVTATCLLLCECMTALSHTQSLNSPDC